MTQILKVVLLVVVLLVGFTCIIYVSYKPTLVDPDNMEVTEYEYNDHSYLVFSYGRCISIVHSPECKCDSIK